MDSIRTNFSNSINKNYKKMMNLNKKMNSCLKNKRSSGFNFFINKHIIKPIRKLKNRRIERRLAPRKFTANIARFSKYGRRYRFPKKNKFKPIKKDLKKVKFEKPLSPHNTSQFLVSTNPKKSKNKPVTEEISATHIKEYLSKTIIPRASVDRSCKSFSSNISYFLKKDSQVDILENIKPGGSMLEFFNKRTYK